MKEYKWISNKPIPLQYPQIRLRLIHNGKFVCLHKGQPTQKMLKKMINTLSNQLEKEFCVLGGGQIQGRFLKEDEKMSCWVPACTAIPMSDLLASLQYLKKHETEKEL